MPREKITFNGEDENHRFDLVVGWSPDQYMQVGIQVSDSDQHIIDILYGDAEQIGQALIEQLRAIGREITDEPFDPKNLAHDVEFTAELLGQFMLCAVRNSRFVERDGVWVDLSRHESNKLVRHVRQARDKVFGKDE